MLIKKTWIFFSSSAKFYNFLLLQLVMINLTNMSNWQYYNYHVCYYLYFQITPLTVSPWGNKTCPNPMVPLSLGTTIILLQVKILEIKSKFVIVWPLLWPMLSDRYVESYNQSSIIWQRCYWRNEYSQAQRESADFSMLIWWWWI